MRPQLALVAPTGAGKSQTLLALAEQIQIEVISADSVQAVQGFDIGSAKPNASERRQLPHHLIDIVPPTERYDAARFAGDAAAIIDAQPQKKFVLTAGTGLYLQALSEGLPPLAILPDAERETLTAWVRSDPAAAHQKLAAHDPVRAGKIHANDWRRLARALEILEVAGRQPSQVLTERGSTKIPLSYVGIWAEGDAYELALRQRVERMLGAGWIAEVEGLIAAHGRQLPLFEAVGYRQIVECLRGDLRRNDLAEQIYLATRRYAKRQRTWFRRKAVAWFDYSGAAVNARLLAELGRRFSEIRG